MLNIDTSYKYSSVQNEQYSPNSPNSPNSSSLFDYEHRSGSNSSISSGNTSPVENVSFFDNCNHYSKPQQQEYENTLLKIELAEMQTRLRALQQEKEGVEYRLNKIMTINAAAINNKKQITELKHEKIQLKKQNEILKKYNKATTNRVSALEQKLGTPMPVDKRCSFISQSSDTRNSMVDINSMFDLNKINNKKGFRGSYYSAQERYKKIQASEKELMISKPNESLDTEDGLNVTPKDVSLSREPTEHSAIQKTNFKVDGKPARHTRNNVPEKKETPSGVCEQFTMRFLAKQASLKHCIFKLDVIDQSALQNTKEVFKKCCFKYCERFGFLIQDLEFRNNKGDVLNFIGGHNVYDGDIIHVYLK